MRTGRRSTKRSDCYYKASERGTIFAICYLNEDREATEDYYFFQNGIDEWRPIVDRFAFNGMHYRIFYCIEDLFGFIQEINEPALSALVRDFL